MPIVRTRRPGLDSGARVAEALVVSNTFDMGEWKAEKEAKLNDASDYEYTGLSSQFFLWTIPAKR